MAGHRFLGAVNNSSPRQRAVLVLKYLHSKLLLYRHALRRYALPTWQRYALNQLVYIGDEFQTAITAILGRYSG